MTTLDPSTRGRANRRSERRQRTVVMALRLSPPERDILVAAAQARGVSLSAFLRDSALDAIGATTP